MLRASTNLLHARALRQGIPALSCAALKPLSSAAAARSPTGQHVAKDGEELEREKHQSLKAAKKEWNEKLATDSEAQVKSHKDNRSPKEILREVAEKKAPMQ